MRDCQDSELVLLDAMQPGGGGGGGGGGSLSKFPVALQAVSIRCPCFMSEGAALEAVKATAPRF